MSLKTSYSIKEVARILFVNEEMVIEWADQAKLILRPKPDSVNNEKIVYRETLIQFMKCYGFPTDRLVENEEAALKEWMLKNKEKLYQALEQYYYDGADCSTEYNEMRDLMGGQL